MNIIQIDHNAKEDSEVLVFLLLSSAHSRHLGGIDSLGKSTPYIDYHHVKCQRDSINC